MLEIILISIVVVVVVSFLWNMSKENREVVVKSGSNVTTIATVSTFKVAKETIKATWSAGKAGAALIDEGGDNIIVSLEEFNEAIAKERGATRYTLKRINKFGEETGLDKVNGIFIDSAREAKARMEEKRAKAKEAKAQKSSEPKEDIEVPEEDMKKVLKEAGIDVDIAKLRSNGLSDEDIVSFVEANKKVVEAVRSATATK